MRLDRYDSYLTTFYTRVTATAADQRGTWVRLARSAFYPTAGGQPHDIGTLGSERGVLEVLDVQTRDGDDDVWHLLADRGGPVAGEVAVGENVVGKIDWPRRWRHMQRHSAQHVLSQALVRVSPAFGTLSVSMRGPDCTIEVGGEIGEDDLAAAESVANDAARQNHPITAFEVDDSRLGEYALRRPAKVAGLVRLVAIGHYDVVACGGTHLRSSAEALPIKVTASERVRGGNTRITFRAGEEAVTDYRAKHEAADALGRAFSAPVQELADRGARLKEELAAAERHAAEWRGRLAAVHLERLAAAARDGVVSAVLEGDDAALLPDLVEACQALPRTVALLAGVADGEARLAFVAGPDTDLDVRPMLQAALASLGGRGGGRPDRAQGAAKAPAAAVREVLARTLATLANR